MSMAKSTFYKEKGAMEAFHLRRKGLDKVQDIELNLFSQRRYTVIDMDKKLNTVLSIASK
jgi:predicted nuclease of predicted toxin-antitoxin system